MSDSVKVAVIQHPPVFLNLPASVNKACNLISEAAENGAKIVAFAETWLTGYPVWLDYSPGANLWNHQGAKELYSTLFQNSITIPGIELNQIIETARSSRTYVVISAHERKGSSLYNALIKLDPQGHFQVHRKLVPTHHERLIWGYGDGSAITVTESPFGNIGGAICWEHWIPLYREVLHSKKEAIHVAQWPGVNEKHQIASRYYAVEGNCFVLAAGFSFTKNEILEGYDSLERSERGRELLESIVSDEKGYVMGGGSSVIGPDGSYVVEPVFNKNLILYADLDLKLLNGKEYESFPEVFQLRVNTRAHTNVSFSK